MLNKKLRIAEADSYLETFTHNSFYKRYPRILSRREDDTRFHVDPRDTISVIGLLSYIYGDQLHAIGMITLNIFLTYYMYPALNSGKVY